jgi:membrane associated rhomboid family serine protease/outer membrane protein assembly factor BamD (BamD/ComL family)
MGTLFSLLFSSPLAAILFLITLFFTTAFIPFKVDRPLRSIPYVTYGLIGTNVMIFLLTVFISNINLPADRIEGESIINKVLAEKKTPGSDGAAAMPMPEGDSAGARQVRQLMMRMRKYEAMKVLSERPKTREGFNQLWKVSHADASYVMEPHYSVLNVWAYRPSEKSFGMKLLGIIGSMFLHGSIMHILGNMIYLWVFGRATEEILGSKVFLSAYLLCGLAAVLMFHATTMAFTPQSAAIPYLGASGAIAGVQGFFALRFYRTPVNIFYIQPISLVVVFILAVIAAVVGGLLLSTIGAVVAFFAVWAAFLIYARKLAFGTFKLAAAWVIGIWLLVFNILPAIKEFVGNEQGGVALWAHIGGFLFGILYAGLIGSKEEGGREYLLEDAQKAYDNSDMTRAEEYANNLLQREPNNAGAYEVLAKSHDRLGNEDVALDNYELAIDHYLQKGERDAAVSAYLAALNKHERFILSPDKQLAVGNQMAKNSDWQNAADTLVKIPYTFPDAPESEMALLRSSQVYLEHLAQPQMTTQLLEYFVQRYPDSQWLPQVERAYRVAQYQMNAPQEQPGEMPVETPAPNSKPSGR